MCVFFSGIIVRPDLAESMGIHDICFTASDSHSEVLNRLNLPDEVIQNRAFIRFECPGCDLTQFSEDEVQTLPRWYDRDNYFNKIADVVEKVKEIRAQANAIWEECEGKKRMARQRYDLDIIVKHSTYRQVLARYENQAIKKINALYSTIKGYIPAPAK